MLDVSGIYSQSLHPVFFPGFVIAYPKNRLTRYLMLIKKINSDKILYICKMDVKKSILLIEIRGIQMFKVCK